MKGLSTTVLIVAVILILSLVLISNYQNIKVPPLVSTTTTTKISQTQIKNLDDVSKNPAYYVGPQIAIEGYVIKNIGAFFGETYFLQSLSGIQNFKNLSESSTGIALVGNYDFESIVSYTFDGRNYNSLNPEVVTVYGTVRDRGSPPPTDVSKYYVEVQNVTAGTATVGPPEKGTLCFSNPFTLTLSGIVSNFSATQTSGSFTLTLSNHTQLPAYIRSHCLGGFGIECSPISYVGYVPKNGDNVSVSGLLWPGEIKSAEDCPNPPSQYLEIINITLQ